MIIDLRKRLVQLGHGAPSSQGGSACLLAAHIELLDDRIAALEKCVALLAAEFETIPRVPPPSPPEQPVSVWKKR